MPNGKPHNPAPQDLAQLLRSARRRPRQIKLETQYRESSQLAKDKTLERYGRAQYFELRNKWSWFLFSFLLVMILFQISLTMLIGFGKVSFKDYDNFLYIVIGENFGQIVAMSFIIVKFLFPSRGKKMTHK